MSAITPLEAALQRAFAHDSEGGEKVTLNELRDAWKAAQTPEQVGYYFLWWEWTEDGDPLSQREVSRLAGLRQGQMTSRAAQYQQYLVNHAIPRVLEEQPSSGVSLRNPPRHNQRSGFIVTGDGLAARPMNNPRSATTTSAIARLWNSRDAATAWVYGNNVELRQTTYAYETHKYRDAYIRGPAPADGMLDLTMVFTPSTHVGSTRAEKLANFLKYARENSYNIRVDFPDGTSLRLPNSDAPGAIRNRAVGEAEFATAWDLEIPLMKGTTTIYGWPAGTSYGGYVERRVTQIHWDG